MVRVTVSVSFQFLMMLIWNGIIVAFLFDMYRMVMDFYQINRWIVAWFDGCVAGIAAIYVFQKLLIWNGGEIRILFVLAIGVGVIFYLKQRARFVRPIAGWILKRIDAILRFCNRLLSRLLWIPLKFIFNACSSVCTRFFLYFWRKIKIKWLTRTVKSS